MPAQLKGWVKLKSIANIDPSRSINYTREYINYVGLAETNDHRINNVLSRPYNEVKGRKIIKNGDVLFARIEPSIFNKKYIYVDGLTETTLSSTEFNVIESKNPKDAKFVLYMLISDPIYKQFVGKLTGSTGRRRLDKDVLKNIWIPYPSMGTREKIISIMDEAFKNKRAKLRQAEDLLKSIDTYLLSVFNLHIPEIKNDLAERRYLVNSKDVMNSRFDAKCYSKYRTILQNELNQSQILKYKLKDLVKGNNSGDWGNDPEKKTLDETICLVIRSTEIDNKYNLLFDDDKFAFRAIKNRTLKKMNLKLGDIIVEKSGGSADQPVGRSVFVDRQSFNNLPLSYSNFLTKLSINTDLVDSYYLFEYLRFMYREKLTDYMQNQTNGIRNLIMNEYLNQIILVPNNHIEIGKHIMCLKEKAKQCEDEAQQCIDSARSRIEQIILGE